MSQRDFASELMNQISSDAGTDPNRILQRQRRRIRNLSVVIIGFWLIALLLITTMLLPMWGKAKQLGLLERPDRTTTAPVASPGSPSHVSNAQIFQAVATVSTFIAIITTLAALLSAIATVWLVSTVRRTTLHQISAALAEISAQLKQLQRPT
jgi:hypothetical protein